MHRIGTKLINPRWQLYDTHSLEKGFKSDAKKLRTFVASHKICPKSKDHPMVGDCWAQNGPMNHDSDKIEGPFDTLILTHPNYHISLYWTLPSAPSPLAKYHQSLDEALTLKQLFMAWYARACLTTVVWHSGKHDQKPTSHPWFI